LTPSIPNQPCGRSATCGDTSAAGRMPPIRCVSTMWSSGESSKGLGLPLGTADVVKFERAELDKLVTLMFSTTVFGWSVGEDLYIVPDNARHIVQTDHHNVIHVSCRTSADVDECVRQMEERGFVLPGEVPDSTFKRPDWMK
jgi:hypothetical protein